MTLNEYLQTAKLIQYGENKMFRNPLHQVICADGASLSVQAGDSMYSLPRNNEGPWTHVEVGYPKPLPSFGLWGTYSNDNGIYAYVPIELVVMYIAAHGGTEFK